MTGQLEPRAWSGPPVECWTCGTTQVPVQTTPVPSSPVKFWTIPVHKAFLGFAPGWCGGSARLLGPVMESIR